MAIGSDPGVSDQEFISSEGARSLAHRALQLLMPADGVCCCTVSYVALQLRIVHHFDACPLSLGMWGGDSVGMNVAGCIQVPAAVSALPPQFAVPSWGFYPDQPQNRWGLVKVQLSLGLRGIYMAGISRPKGRQYGSIKEGKETESASFPGPCRAHINLHYELVVGRGLIVLLDVECSEMSVCVH